MRNLLVDLRYALRSLSSAPGMIMVSVLSLGLGIGANLTLFTGVRAIFLRTPTAAHPEELLVVEPGNNNQFSFLNYKDLRASGIFGNVLGYRNVELNLREGNNAYRVEAIAVSDNYFEMLQVPAALGRTFTAEEAAAEKSPRLAVLSYAYWKAKFGRNTDIHDVRLLLNGEPFSVIGVLPETYQPLEALSSPGIFVPVSTLVLPNLSDRSNGNALNVVARLKPGSSAQAAQAAVTALGTELERIYPDANDGMSRPARLSAFGELPGEAFIIPVLLSALCGLVLLIACGNVAGILLARGATRRRETAIRAALGASRGRLVQSLLAEGILLSVLAAIAGLLLMSWLTSLLTVLNLPASPPQYLSLQRDFWLYLFAVGLALATALICGTVPALKATEGNPAAEFQDGGRGSTARARLRRAFVVAQVAASLALLVVSSLFLRSLMRLTQFDPGFSLDGIVATLHVPSNRYTPASLRQLEEQVITRLATLPGVQSTSVSNLMPLGGDRSASRFQTESQPEMTGARTFINTVGPRFFQTMGIRMLAGREFGTADREGAAPVVIVNQAFADAYYPGEAALGKRVKIDAVETADIIGVVANTSYGDFGERLEPQLYFAFDQRPSLSTQVRPLFVIVQAPGAGALMPAIRQAIEELDAGLIVEVGTVRQATDYGPGIRRLGTLLIGILGSVGLLLAMIGLYGVMTFAVTSRTAEIGIRIALGASPSRVLGTILYDGMRLVITGLVIGAAISLAVAQSLKSLLAGLSPTDPPAFAAAGLLLIIVGIAACYIPARRATRFDPVEALRQQ